MQQTSLKSLTVQNPIRVFGIFQRIIVYFLSVALFATIFPSSAIAAASSGCSIPPVEDQAVVKIDRLGNLHLQDGRLVRAEGIRLPQGASDHAPESFAKAAHAELLAMVEHQRVGLVLRPPDRDRYGRLRAQIFIGKDRLWLQQEMLQRGLARVDIAPSHVECANALYAAENNARMAKRGLWSTPEYSVRTPDKLAHDTDTFQLVQGNVVSAAVRKSRAYLDFGEDWRTDFTVTISPEDMRNFRAANVDPLNYVNKTVCVRGIIDKFHGPEMAIASPASIEIVKSQH